MNHTRSTILDDLRHAVTLVEEVGEQRISNIAVSGNGSTREVSITPVEASEGERIANDLDLRVVQVYSEGLPGEFRTWSGVHGGVPVVVYGAAEAVSA